MSQMGTYVEVSKLVGTGAIGSARQGYSVKLSEDGNFLFIAGIGDSGNIGAVWFYEKISGVWTQKQKIVPSGYSGTPNFGTSVAVNPSMTTLIVGARNDDSSIGALFVFTFDGTSWTQQDKLVGDGVTGSSGSGQGHVVGLSADANTAIAGGPNDGNYVGASWVFVRVGNMWSQQGSKLVGTDSTTNSNQGQSVALTSDGNLIVVGGYGDQTGIGAIWVYLRSSTSWNQVGSKITATGGVGAGYFGVSLALSGDDQTLVVGGNADNVFEGAAWIFKRNGNTFTQFGNKLVGTGATSNSQQGWSVAVNTLGTLVAVGAPWDSSDAGAVFMYFFDGTHYNQLENKIMASDAIENAQQGDSVSLDGLGSHLLFGGSYDNGNIGAAWIYTNAAITSSPSAIPSTQSTLNPTAQPSVNPTMVPSVGLTTQPSVGPTVQPSLEPTTQPSLEPTTQPSLEPTTQPSVGPTTQPSVVPTAQPSVEPTTQPSEGPTTQPSVGPTTQPSVGPTTEPSVDPTVEPSLEPTTQPSVGPSTQPSVGPTTQPSLEPTTQPSILPTTQPSVEQTFLPSLAPSVKPTAITTSKPTSAFSNTSSGAFLSLVTVIPVLVLVCCALMYFFFRVYKKHVNKEGVEMRNWIEGNKGEITLHGKNFGESDNNNDDDDEGLEVTPMDNPLQRPPSSRTISQKA